MAKVFPENMDQVDIEHDLKGAVKVLEAYVRYVCERTDFAINNVSKVAASAGSINVDAVQRIQGLEDDVAVLNSTIAKLNGSVTATQDDISKIKNEYEILEARVATLEEKPKE